MPSRERILNLAPSIGHMRLEEPGSDPLGAITGVVWGALLGGAFWLTALTLALGD